MEHKISARCYAQSVADNLTASYWTESSKTSLSEFVLESAHKDFAKLAELMGYRIEKIEGGK